MIADDQKATPRLEPIYVLVVFELRSKIGFRFGFMVNHLYRGNRGDNRFKRSNQSESLNRWARTFSLPLVAVGDYNYDFDIDDEGHDPGFDRLTQDDVFQWIRPQKLVGTQCSEGNSDPRSILDFVFVAGTAREWTSESVVLEAQSEYCPDSSERSDHRPVKATFELPD